MGIAERWRGFSGLPPNIEQALELLVPLLKRKGVLLAYLFGSLSRGKAGNDVDLAILTRGRPAFQLREAITGCLRTERVDLVDLQNASPVLRLEVIRTGRPLYVADGTIQDHFKLQTLNLYRDTAPLRRRQRECLKWRMAQWSKGGSLMVKREVVEERLKELDEILQELQKYLDISWEAFQANLSQRWIIERGLLAAASIVFDIADHILASHFGYYPETYEESLKALGDKEIISKGLYRQLKGLGGFRNILVHRYLGIDPQEVFKNFRKVLGVFPRFAREVLTWLEKLENS